MNEQRLLAVDNYGAVLALSTRGDTWERFVPRVAGMHPKHVSAVGNHVWSIGGDNQPYVLVHGPDGTTTRVRETVYENERWMPGGRFSKRLLPTDRYRWSSENGRQEKCRENVKLPSFVWQWEHEWKLDTTLDGNDLDDDGWTYAVDFYTKYYPTERWNSCVRRRKWFRNRIYTGTNSWCIISPLHEDFTREPFICVTAGGDKIPGARTGVMMVWAVTAQGRIFYRKNVDETCPEGGFWVCVPAAEGGEARYVDCGPSGSVWVILWSGAMLVRKLVTADMPQGKEWAVVESPEARSKLTRLSVGLRSVWAVANDSRVWYRKGIDHRLDEGTRWIRSNTFMFSVSVASNDQVFSVGLDRHLYFRSEVSGDNPTGQKWVRIRASVEVDRPDEPEKKPGGTESLVTSSSFTEPSHSAPTRLTGNVSKNVLDFDAEEINPPQRRVSAWSPKHSVGSLIGTEAKPDSFVGSNATGRKPKTTFWSCVVTGSLEPDARSVSQWFRSSSDGENVLKSRWRREILEELVRLRSQEKEFQRLTSFALDDSAK